MNIRKNLLDIHYQKYLVLYTTTLGLVWTYIIGMLVAVTTNIFVMVDALHVGVIASISLLVIGIASYEIKKFKKHLIKIPKEIKKLEYET